VKWHEDDNHYELESGRRIYASGGVLGLGPKIDSRVYSGWDDVDLPGEPLTDAERNEIAAEMINRWMHWSRGEEKP
jgi:hypothetical protein